MTWFNFDNNTWFNFDYICVEDESDQDEEKRRLYTAENKENTFLCVSDENKMKTKKLSGSEKDLTWQDVW